MTSRYVLEIGEAGAERLSLVDQVLGPYTREVLLDRGLAEGMDVCDIGCGTGDVAMWIAERVGPAGSVVAVDRSNEQLELVRAKARRRDRSYVTTVHADATSVGLPDDAFDIVFSRGMLDHLSEADASAAVVEMARITRPGGTVIVTDGDLSGFRTIPRTEAYAALRDMWLAAGAAAGADFERGGKLQPLLREAGLREIDLLVRSPAFLRGEEKRFFSSTVKEGRPHLERLGLAPPEGLDALFAAVDTVDADEGVAVVLDCVACWGRRPASAG